ncbi:MAG: aldo/keto reductase [Nitrospirae bacterium]|nr:aldo/keto reductase [Nitrospirota bacterium]
MQVMIEKLIIGSANFGLEYGVANRKKLDKAEVFTILGSLYERGLWGLDTARAYGAAESVIGEFFSERGKHCKVITKLPNREYCSVEDVEKEIGISLRNLCVDSIDCVLLHSYQVYRQYNDFIRPALKSLRSAGVIGQYGISVYHREEADEFVKEAGERVALEFPLNLFDRRFLDNGFLPGLKARGHTLFARSVFLQGLFFLNREDLTGVFAKVREKIEKINRIADEHRVNTACLALLFVAAQPWIDGIITGVDSNEHLMSNIGCLSETNMLSFRDVENLLSDVRVDDEEIILPYKWEMRNGK